MLDIEFLRYSNDPLSIMMGVSNPKIPIPKMEILVQVGFSGVILSLRKEKMLELRGQ